jgi:hypothetical protein
MINYILKKIFPLSINKLIGSILIITMSLLFLSALIHQSIALYKINNKLRNENIDYKTIYQQPAKPAFKDIKILLKSLYTLDSLPNYNIFLLAHRISTDTKTNIGILINNGEELSIMDNGSLISAEVILKSKSGKSLSNRESAITSKNVKEFQPAEETIIAATDHLHKLGFTVLDGNITLTIIGEKSLFEKVFDTKLDIKKDQKAKRIIVHPNKDLPLPASLSDIVEKIVFVPSPEFFTNY